jgi:hypothetical protein
MIFANPTKYGAGITVYGDLHDFQNLHETTHHLTELSPLIDGRGEFVLGLAYEVRHAYQGDREMLKLPADLMESETTTYFGFRELWPNFLMQLGLLRWAAGFQPTNKEHHANLFRLEACAESALTTMIHSLAGDASSGFHTLVVSQIDTSCNIFQTAHFNMSQ